MEQPTQKLSERSSPSEPSGRSGLSEPLEQPIQMVKQEPSEPSERVSSVIRFISWHICIGLVLGLGIIFLESLIQGSPQREINSKFPDFRQTASDEFFEELIQQNSLSLIKHPDAEVPLEDFDRNEWSWLRTNYRRINYTEILKYNPINAFYVTADEIRIDNRHIYVPTYPQLTCPPLHNIYRTEIKQDIMVVVRNAQRIQLSKVPEEFFLLPDELNRTTLGQYMSFVRKFGPTYIDMVEFGAKLTVNFYFTNEMADTRLRYCRDNFATIIRLISIGLIDDINKYAPEDPSELPDFELAKELLTDAKIFRFNVIGPAYPGNILDWMKEVQRQKQYAPVKFTTRGFTDITMHDRSKDRAKYNRIQDRLIQIAEEQAMNEVNRCCLEEK